MKIRVGVVGPKDTVDTICLVGQEFSQKIKLLPYVYRHFEETAKIILAYEQEVDVWFLSGQVPYSAVKKLNLKQKAFFPKISVNLLNKVLLEIVYRDGFSLDRISFDTFSEETFHEALEDLGFTCEKAHLYPYEEDMTSAQLIERHLSLFRQGKVEACATGMLSVYEELKRQGIPVYRMSFNRMTFRDIFHFICQEGETLHFKRSQIAVQLIEISDDEKTIEKYPNSYEILRLDLKLQEMILDYTETISGSFVSLGNGKFIIFSTRGSFEDNTDFHPTKLMDKIMLLTNSDANMGIGFGITALSAEKNAQLALNHAKKSGCGAVIRIDHDGSIEGPLNQPTSITFGYRVENKEISESLKRAGVSITTFNRIISVQNSLGQDFISASDLAEWLSMTKRHARRILSDLAEENLVELIGEESPTNRGRPRRIYRVLSGEKL